ncbi:MAG: Ig-like domain-containing protein [Rubrivivax sp.]
MWKRWLSMSALLALAACGGGGGSSGTQVLGSGNTSNVADIVIELASDTVSNTSTTGVDAIITAVDANRRGVSGVTLTVGVNANAVVSTAAATTDASGKLKATIGIGSDRTNRDITVSVSVGSVTRTAVLKVVTDPGTNKPTADDMTLVLSAPSVTNGGTSTVVATATAVDRNRNVVTGIPVTFSVDSTATASVSGTSTNANGVVTATVSIGSDRSNRVITVTATSGALVRKASFAVIGAKLTVSAAPQVVSGSAGNVVEYTLVDFNSLAMVDQPITVSAPGLPTATGRTDLNGKFRYVYTAPAATASLQVVATAAGDQRTVSVAVSPATSGVAAAPEMPVSATVTPTPTVVPVNSVGSTVNQVELRALFVGANNKPVPRVRVRFDLAGNTTNTDGTVSWVGSYAYSDENGIARGTFTPGQRSSPTNGVTVRICYDTVDFASGPAGGCDQVLRTAQATLTVSAEALSVSIATNNEIKSGLNNLTYIKEYVVMVVDSAGLAKADAQIVPSVDLLGYRKGFYFFNGRLWEQRLTLLDTEHYRWTGNAWALDPSGQGFGICPNEDINRNGVREAGLVVAGATPPPLESRQEDLNWNNDLDPRKSFVAVKVLGTGKTDANGLAIVQLEYGESVASWIDFMLTVSASGVSGTEARARYSDTLPVQAFDITSEAIPPAFRISPFGTGTVCTDTL